MKNFGRAQIFLQRFCNDIMYCRVILTSTYTAEAQKLCRALAAAIFGVFATGADVFFDYELPETLQPLFILIFLGFTIGVGYGNYDAWKNYEETN